MRIRVKYCGITRVEDAQHAAWLGVDAIGLVFYPKSPRYVHLDQAKAIRYALPAFVNVVALFVNPDANDVENVIDAVNPDYLQFHGDETENDCKAFSYPYIKALRVGEDFDASQEILKFTSAVAILLDAKAEGLYGGTGKTFDWKKFGADVKKPDHQIQILAGGLNPHNIAQAIQVCGPSMVDVSGGIESAPGIKDHQKMAEFMQVVSRVYNLSVS